MEYGQDQVDVYLDVLEVLMVVFIWQGKGFNQVFIIGIYDDQWIVFGVDGVFVKCLELDNNCILDVIYFFINFFQVMVVGEFYVFWQNCLVLCDVYMLVNGKFGFVMEVV